jgi:16S rRNA (cytosine967-C5)-methyltransferase
VKNHRTTPIPSPKPILLPDPTRSAALSLLSAVLDRHRPLEDALDSLPPMDARDRAAAHRLAAAALRRRGTIDAVLEPYLQRTPPAEGMHILRLGAAALLFLETPAHAAVGTAVALARARNMPKLAGLVNAVLRRVAETGAAALEELDGPRLDTPPWLWTSWGPDARDIATAHQHEAALDLTLGTRATAPEGGLALPTGSVRFPPGTRVTDLPGFETGGFWVQDAAAALPARLLGAEPGQQVADLCAAPGGKTTQLAAAGALVTAVDRTRGRLNRLKDNLTRLSLTAELVCADAAEWQAEPFDAVLLDAPCSSTGTIRRHPDVPWLKQPADISSLAALQRRLLERAVALTKPGGTLIYCTCSLEPEENETVIADLLARESGVRRAPITAADVFGRSEFVTKDGDLRTLPCHLPDADSRFAGVDGFYAARLVK